MRYLILTLIISALLLPELFSQEKKLTIRTGAGYYMDTFGVVGGQIVWLEGGVKLNTGFFCECQIING